MKVSLTDLQRATKRVFRPVHNGQTVRVTEHGKPVAVISPDAPERVITADEFRAMEIPDEELDKAIERAIEESRR
jgi:prevent-host-death family protein